MSIQSYERWQEKIKPCRNNKEVVGQWKGTCAGIVNA